MRVLFDANVIIDFIIKREPFSDNAAKAIELCVANNDIQASIAAHTIPNLFYILRKHLSPEQRRDILLGICRIFTVVGVDTDRLVSALQNDGFTDFEDCLQAECAKYFKADYIVTRNTKDFSGSVVPAIEPSDFVDMHKSYRRPDEIIETAPKQAETGATSKEEEPD